MKDIISRMEYDYNIYSVIGFILSIAYFAALVFGVAVGEKNLSQDARDTVNGIYWALIYFGTPVMFLLSIFGFFSSSHNKARGRVFAVSAFIMPLLLIYVVYSWWPSVFL